MARRRSPEDVLIRASKTEESIVTCSASAMYESRDAEDDVSSGVKRNLEQREAKGSMILLQIRLFHDR